MQCCCERAGAPQAFHLDLKNGDMKQMTDAVDLDGASLTLTPDNRQFCYVAGRSLYIALVSNLKERELYKIPDGWDAGGLSVGPDGTHASLIEKRGEPS